MNLNVSAVLTKTNRQAKHFYGRLFPFSYFRSGLQKCLRWYRFTAKNYQWWSLLSVASIRRKLLKTTLTEERSVQTNSESCNIRLRSQKINLITNKSFRYYKQYSSIIFRGIRYSKYFWFCLFKIIFRWRWIFVPSWKIWKCRLHYQKSSKQE